MITDLFTSRIFPGFPFRNQSWLAVAFERNRYDGTRMPEAFFRKASLVFNPSCKSQLLITGDCFVVDGRSHIALVGFDWDDYSGFMRSKEGFSLEYKMASDSGDWGCWADQELTVVGGEQDKMTVLLEQCGGREYMLNRMEAEFFLDEPVGNEDMRAYFRGLLFPRRPPGFE